MPAVSICIPASAQVADLERTLDSVVVQKFLDYEVVVTDASSGDAAERLVNSYDFGGRLRYFRNAHAPGDALNRDEALRLAQAPLIKLLFPGDQFAHAQALARFVELLESAPDSTLACAAGVWDAHVPRPAPDADSQARLRRLPESLLIEDVIGPLSLTIYRRSPALEFDPRLKALAACDMYIRALRMTPRLAVDAVPLILLAGSERANAPGAAIAETFLVFGKAVDLLQQEPTFAVHFWKLLQDLGIRNSKQLARLVPMTPPVAEYFGALFANPPRGERRGLAARVAALLRR